MTGADSSARPARVTQYESAPPSSATIEPMTTADVLDAAPPDLTPSSPRRSSAALRPDADCRALVSERDQNFRLTDADGAAWVLKVSNAVEDRGVVEMEVAAVEHIARSTPACPCRWRVPALDGSTVVIGGVGDGVHLVRLLPLLPGHTAAPAELDLGPSRTSVRSSAASAMPFAASSIPPPVGPSLGSAAPAPAVRHAGLIEDGERRRAARSRPRALRASVLPALPGLRAQVIHNDVTLDNLLLDDGHRVTGIIDFGDMAHTALVLDIPATLQSLVRDRTDLFDVADAFLAGYASVIPLEEPRPRCWATCLPGEWRRRS